MGIRPRPSASTSAPATSGQCGAAAFLIRPSPSHHLFSFSRSTTPASSPPLARLSSLPPDPGPARRSRPCPHPAAQDPLSSSARPWLMSSSTPGRSPWTSPAARLPTSPWGWRAWAATPSCTAGSAPTSAARPCAPTWRPPGSVWLRAPTVRRAPPRHRPRSGRTAPPATSSTWTGTRRARHCPTGRRRCWCTPARSPRSWRPAPPQWSRCCARPEPPPPSPMTPMLGLSSWVSPRRPERSSSAWWACRTWSSAPMRTSPGSTAGTRTWRRYCAPGWTRAWPSWWSRAVRRGPWPCPPRGCR